jgi:C-terminal processing protease CtpA/Prc
LCGARAQAGGAEGYVLDLRNNPGGLVRAGLDIARLWLDGSAAIFNVQVRVAPPGIYGLSVITSSLGRYLGSWAELD